MKIKSIFADNTKIPEKYTCDGNNINPAIEISDVPKGAKSLVLIVDDLDAPGGTFVHWVVWNISPKTEIIAEDSIPEDSMQGINSAGRQGYLGPCPPSGTHRYRFKLYAPDTALSLPTSSKRADVESAMKNHILAQAILIGLYSS